jgi:hypothetical protein
MPNQQSLFDEIDGKKYLQDCRVLAEDIARRKGHVAQSDVNKVYPRPTNLHPNITGAIFRGNKKFKMIGIRESLTGSRKKGIERIWTIREETT